MTRKIFTKTFAVALSILILFSFSFAAFAAEEGYPLGIELAVSPSVKTNGVYAGVTFDVPVVLSFDELFLENVGGGIIVLQFTLQFDSSKLQLVDYYSHEPIEFDETGTAINGLPFIFGTIANESRFSVQRSNTGKIIVSYFSSTNSADDITVSDTLVTFSMRARDDIAINGSTNTTLAVAGPYAAGVKEGANIRVETESVPFNINAPFKLAILGDTIIGDAASVVGRHFIDRTSSEPITMQIQRDSQDVEPARTLSASKSSIIEPLTFDEEVYSPGSYTITFRYRDMVQQVFAEVKPAIVIPEPEPTPTPTPEPEETPDNGGEENEDVSTPTPTPTVTPTPTPTTSPKPTTPPRPSTNTGGNNTGGNSLVGGDKKEETTATPSPSSSPAPDYPSDTAGHWAKDNITYVYDHKLMNGYADGTFRPGASITRAEFSTVMARFLGLEPDESASQFTDCEGHWARGYIGVLAEKGIVTGMSDTAFSPDTTVTREQIAVILSRAFALTDKSADKYVDDASISSWAYDGVYAVRAAGYMLGDAVGCFQPRQSATRAEVATIIARLHVAAKSA